MTRMFAALVLVFAASSALPAESPELALVPEDTAVFMHLRAAELWKHDALQPLRETLAAAGPKAIADYEKQVYPNPGDLDTITIFSIIRDKDFKDMPGGAAIFTFKKDLDAAKLRSVYLPDAKEKTVAGKTIWADEDSVGLAFWFADARRVVIGPAEELREYLSKPPAKGGPLADEIRGAASKTFTVAVNFKAFPIPKNAFEIVPEAIRPLTKVERLHFSLEMATAEPSFDFRLGYANEAAAKDAEQGFKAAVEMAREFLKGQKEAMEQKLSRNAAKGPRPPLVALEATVNLMAIGSLNQSDAFLTALPVARSGVNLQVKMKLQKDSGQSNGLFTIARYALPAAAAYLTSAIPEDRPKR